MTIGLLLEAAAADMGWSAMESRSASAAATHTARNGAVVDAETGAADSDDEPACHTETTLMHTTQTKKFA